MGAETSVPKIPDTNCYAMDYSEVEASALGWCFLLLSPLSVLGSLFIIASYVQFDALQNPMFKVIAWLSVADFFKSWCYVVDAYENPANECVENAACTLRGNLRNFFGLSTFLWSGAIALVVHRVVVRQEPPPAELSLHGVCWGVPACGMLITSVLGACGDAGYKCWITRDHSVLRWLLYYIPLLCVWVAMTRFYVATHATLQSASPHTAARAKVMYLYLGTFIFVRFWSVLDTAWQTLFDSDPFVLALLHCLASPLQGLANALVYGSSVAVRAQWSRKFPDIFEHRWIEPWWLPGGAGRGGLRTVNDPAYPDANLEDGDGIGNVRLRCDSPGGQEGASGRLVGGKDDEGAGSEEDTFYPSRPPTAPEPVIEVDLGTDI
jgi:hypothetical protein